MTYALLMWQIVHFAPLLAICSVGPGLFFVRRMAWTPAETLCASVAASMIFVGLGSMAIFWLDLQPVGAMHWWLSAICLLLDVVCWQDLLRLGRHKSVRRLVGMTGAVLLWQVLLVSVIRHYGGGIWWGDWLEHYQRSQFFLNHGPSHYRFLDEYLIVERPPLMNLICGHYMAQIGTEFSVYQLAAVALNSLPVLPCCLFASSVSRWRRRAPVVLLLLLVASPMFVQNVTFVWTKSFAAFFALLGLWFYLRGWLKGDRTRLTTGFVFVTAGCLVHLSILPWLAVLAAHYLVTVWPSRPKRLGEAAMIALPCAAMLLSWYGWAISQYGIRTTFTAQVLQPNPGLAKVPTLTRMTDDIFDTIVPFFLRPSQYVTFRQHDQWGLVRDLAFSLYQTNAIFAFGSVGLAALVFAMARGIVPWERWPFKLRRFWTLFVFGTTILGLCMVPRPEPWGAAHQCLLPLVLLGLSVLGAIAVKLPRPWVVCLLAGCVVDFLLGILLHVHLEQRTFAAVTTVTPGRPFPFVHTLSVMAASNFLLKVQFGLSFIGDVIAPAALAVQGAVCVAFIVLLSYAALEKRRGNTPG